MDSEQPRENMLFQLESALKTYIANLIFYTSLLLRTMQYSQAPAKILLAVSRCSALYVTDIWMFIHPVNCSI